MKSAKPKTYKIKLELTLSQLSNLRFCLIRGEQYLTNKASDPPRNAIPEMVEKLRQNAVICRDLYRLVEEAAPTYWADQQREDKLMVAAGPRQPRINQ